MAFPQHCADTIQFRDIFPPESIGEEKNILFVLEDDIWRTYNVNTYYYFTGDGNDLEEILSMINHYDRRRSCAPHLFDGFWDPNDKKYKNHWKIYLYETKKEMYSHMTNMIINDRLRRGKNNEEGNRINVEDITSFHPLYPEYCENITQVPDLLRLMALPKFMENHHPEFIQHLHLVLKTHYTRQIYYELIKTALHPDKVGRWLEAHLANGGGLDDFEF